MKEYCEHYTLDCQAEKMGCEGCGFYKNDLNDYCDGNYDEVGVINNKIEEIRETETYGTGAYKITDKNIEDLKNGKLLVVYPNDEYTCIFKYEGRN